MAALLALALVALPATATAAAPFEPNDSIVAAAGPIGVGQIYEAELETPADRDFFYFYATSAPTVEAAIAIRNLSGTGAGGLNAAIVDSTGTTIDAFAYFLSGGNEASKTIALAPQKYFLEVKPSSENVGTTPYSFSTGGGSGAFGAYSQIAAQCGAGRTAVERARRGVRRAEGKLQRATARVRQSVFGLPAEREAAKASYRQARSRLAAKRKALRAAKRLLSPWCFIPQ